MRVANLFVSMVVIIILSGCATASRQRVQNESSEIYEEGYRKGVEENIHNYTQAFEGGDFPYFHWAEPTIQYVDVPAQIANGVFIPEHTEPVIIKPGEWKYTYGYPIKGNRRNHEQAKITYSEAHVVDLTTMPHQFGGGTTNESGGKVPTNP